MRVSYANNVSIRKAQALANSNESGILNNIGSHLYGVTEDAIQSVPKIVPQGWSEQRAIALQEAHKDLLRFVKGRPIETEAGAIYSPNMHLIKRVMGEPYQVRMPPYDGEHILIHNHPSGMVFSAADIRKFINNVDMSVLTAVGNNGSVFVIQRAQDYLGAEFVKAFAKITPVLNAAKTPADYSKIMMEFLEETTRYGVQFISGGQGFF